MFSAKSCVVLQSSESTTSHSEVVPSDSPVVAPELVHGVGTDGLKFKTLPPSVVKDIEQKNIARRLAAEARQSVQR